MRHRLRGSSRWTGAAVAVGLACVSREARAQGRVAQGKSLDEVERAKPTAEFDAKWGTGGITAEMLIETTYSGFKARSGR